MKRTVSIIFGVVAAAVLALAPGAFADANCPGVGNDCPTTNNTTNNIGGNAAAAAAAAASADSSSRSTSTAIANPVQVTTQGQQQGQGQHQGQGQIQGQGQDQGQGQGQVQGNKNSIKIEGDRTEIPAQAPAVFSPNLTASPEACMGSVSGGGGAGFNGISFGFNMGMTWKNEDCERRAYAERVRAIGDVDVARALLQGSPMVAEAYRKAGKPVAGELPAEEPKKVSSASPTVITRPDVLVRDGGAVVAPVKIEKRDGSDPAQEGVGERLGQAMRETQSQAAAAVQGS